MTAAVESPRVAILGSGYVGTALAVELVRRGVDGVVTTTRSSRRDELRAMGLTPVVLTLPDDDRLPDLLRDRTGVCLTVAPTEECRDYRAVYLQSARGVVAALRGTPVTRLIYTSSTSVYGQDDGGWVDESAPTEPVTDNAKVLLETERCLLGATAPAGLHVTVLRLGGIYGPDRNPADRIRQAAGTVRDDGETYLNMIHRDDIVSAMFRLLTFPHHGVLNLSDDEPSTRRASYDRVLAAAGLAPIRWAVNPTNHRGKRVCSSRIKQLLNWTTRHPRHLPVDAGERK